MDGDTLATRVTDAQGTALSRLGSSKAVYALTAGEMSGDALAAAVATDLARAAALFDRWASEGGGVFADAAARAAESRDRIADGSPPAKPSEVDDSPPPYPFLAGLDTPVERAAGLLGWSLVTDRVLGQVVGFYVGDASPTTADLVRELRDALAENREAAVKALDSVCDTDAEWERARAVTSETVECAYDAHVARLEALGVEAKDIC